MITIYTITYVMYISSNVNATWYTELVSVGCVTPLGVETVQLDCGPDSGANPTTSEFTTTTPAL
jgi:hypothetical protein